MPGTSNDLPQLKPHASPAIEIVTPRRLLHRVLNVQAPLPNDLVLSNWSNTVTGSGNIQSSPGEVEHGAEGSNKPTAAIVFGAHLAGFDSFKRRIVNLNRSLAAVDIEQANLKYLLENLMSSTPGYSGQRNGFLITHGGDARSDARLYGAPGGRTDVETFEKLYGILPETVEKISCIKTIAALDTHAGVVTSNFKTGSERFYQLFWEFVSLLKESGTGYQEGYLDNGPIDLVNAYHAFMGCINTEVTL
ncbi:hypothetical protein HOY82DRAFT_641132 [Tuber indicum]|nr:hypothetical protein HOY82DRAFT_641132 [Tuber indicum]